VGTLLVGGVAGWTARGGGAEKAQPQLTPATVTVTAPTSPPITVSAEPLPAVTVTATAPPVAPVTVTASPALPAFTSNVASPECLRALALADQGFGLAKRGFSASTDAVNTMTAAVRAASRGNFGALPEASAKLEAGTAELTVVTNEINGLADPYNSARVGCIGR